MIVIFFSDKHYHFPCTYSIYIVREDLKNGLNSKI